MDLSNLTSLPTDSLYKFMALAGVTILIVAAVVPAYFRRKFEFERVELVRDFEILKLKRDALGQQIKKTEDRLRKAHKGLDALSSEGSTDNAETDAAQQTGHQKKVAVEREVGEIERLQGRLLKKTQALTVQAQRIGCATEKATWLRKELNAIAFAQGAGLVLGACLSVGGFYFWYTRIQVYIDRAYSHQSQAPRAGEPFPGRDPNPTTKRTH